MFGGESGSFDSSLGVVSTAEYGKVFISIKSTTGLDLTSQEKTQLVTDLAPYTIASTTPVIVDPLTVSLILNTNFYYITILLLPIQHLIFDRYSALTRWCNDINKNAKKNFLCIKQNLSQFPSPIRGSLGPEKKG